MNMALPEANEASAERKSKANIMVPIQGKSKDKKHASGKSLGGAESKKEYEGKIEIDDVALTFPQRVSVN
jgi:hypothetical protein